MDVYYNTPLHIDYKNNNVNSTYNLSWEISCSIQELEYTCPICLDYNVDTRLNCGHCLCSDCVKNLIKPITNIIYTLESTLQVSCKTCNVVLISKNIKFMQMYHVIILSLTMLRCYCHVSIILVRNVVIYYNPNVLLILATFCCDSNLRCSWSVLVNCEFCKYITCLRISSIWYGVGSSDN